MDEEERILELTLMIRRRCMHIEQNKHDETLNGYMRIFELVNFIETKILRLIKIKEEKEKLNKE